MWCKPLIFQTQIISSGMDSSVHSLKYLRCRTLDYTYTDQKIRVCDKDSSPLGGDLKNTFPSSGQQPQNISRFRLEIGDYLQVQVSTKEYLQVQVITKEYLQVQVSNQTGEYLQVQFSNQRISPGSSYKLENISKFRYSNQRISPGSGYKQVPVCNKSISPGSGYKLENISRFRLATKEYHQVQVRN